MKYLTGVALIGALGVGAYFLFRKDSEGRSPGRDAVKDAVKDTVKNLTPYIPSPPPIAVIPGLIWLWRKAKR